VSTPLTRRRLLAIEEALHFRLAGELDDTSIPQEDYKAALRWVEELTRKREESK
jgi:hypothetical protein